jgi:hypothetical protein
VHLLGGSGQTITSKESSRPQLRIDGSSEDVPWIAHFRVPPVIPGPFDIATASRFYLCPYVAPSITTLMLVLHPYQ